MLVGFSRGARAGLCQCCRVTGLSSPDVYFSHVSPHVAAVFAPQGWEVNCTAPLASWSGSSTECGATSPAPCTVKQPSVQLNNPQVLPYDTHALGRASAGGQSVVPGTGRPLSASFDLTDATPIEFTSARLATSDVGAAVRTITFDFSLNRPGLVHYRVTEEVDKVGGCLLCMVCLYGRGFLTLCQYGLSLATCGRWVYHKSCLEAWTGQGSCGGCSVGAT